MAGNSIRARVKRKAAITIILIVLALAASACGPSGGTTDEDIQTAIASTAAAADAGAQEVAEAPDAVAEEASEAAVENPPPPVPTATPAQTATPEPTSLPEGVLFRDEFQGTLADGWTWMDEDPARWSFAEDGWLEIVGADQSFLWQGNTLINFLARPAPIGEFMITAHVRANPSENFQQATIFLFEDGDNYIALNTGYCGVCLPGGTGFYFETFIDNNPFQDAYSIGRDAGASDVYLRLVNQGGSVTGYYATQPDNWQRAGAFGNYFDFKMVGLGTTNAAPPEGVTRDIVAQFDYFEIREP